MIADPIATFSDTDLERMTARAWRDAARSWSEYRAADSGPLRAALRLSAVDAEEYWMHLDSELRRRLAAGS